MDGVSVWGQHMKATLMMLFLCAACTVHGNEVADARFVSVKVYFVGWDVLTRVPLGIRDVIRMKRVYFEINDPGLANNFVDWLRLSQMQQRKSLDPEDARLVIELTRDNGGVVILYASEARLLSADSSSFREVDDEFRNRFDLAHKTTR